jgi:hypothetical protein
LAVVPVSRFARWLVSLLSSGTLNPAVFLSNRLNGLNRPNQGKKWTESHYSCIPTLQFSAFLSRHLCVFAGGTFYFFLVEPGSLGPVAAISHVAPTPAPVAADVDKQPAAGRIGTGFNFISFGLL